MRHLKRNTKFGRRSEHRGAMLANMACSFIKHQRITTTITKAKVLRPVVEKLITLGRHGNQAVEAAKSATDDKQKKALAAQNVHYRRLAAAKLRQQARSHFRGTPTRKGKVLREKWKEEHDVVHLLFDRIAPVFKGRDGGYTRIIKLGHRTGDASQMAILELVEMPGSAEPAPAEPAKTA
jgi:large subunit ribosomal protein L17